jgi:hypothetical protein
MGVKSKIRTLGRGIRNAQYMRFPTLVHPVVDPVVMEAHRLPQQCSLTDEFLTRLCRAFNLSPTVANTDIWADLSDYSGALRQALANHDLSMIRQELADAFGAATYGMAHTKHMIGRDGLYGPTYFSIRCRDTLQSLAEAVGVAPLHSNQQTAWADYRAIMAHQDDLVGEVERALGYSIRPTPFGGPPVVTMGGAILNPDFIRHAYVMHRVRQLAVGQNESILEIGGGFGCVARYARLADYRDYTIVDLPFANAVQAAFLANDFGEDAVCLYGEPQRSEAFKFYPDGAKSELSGRYSLTINMDSLPEIGDAPAYVGIIARQSRLFLSINQEARTLWKGFKQHHVPSLLDRDRFRLRSRHRYWMEQGYAEEVYETVS